MVGVGEISVPLTDAKVEIYDPKLNAVNSVPFAFLSIQMNFLNKQGTFYESPSTKGPIKLEVLPLSVSLLFGGLPVAYSYSIDSPRLDSAVTILLPISSNALDFIESNRKDDVTFIVNITYEYYIAVPGNPVKTTGLSRNYNRFNIKVTATEWLKILRELEYSNRIMLELEVPNITLPKLKGFEEVLEKIKEAKEKLFSRSKPEDVISDLRSTWDLVDKYISEYNKEIKDIIKEKSKAEKDQPQKEERVERIQKSIINYLGSINELKESIDKFTQIGPHREIYFSTREDAELAFRLTVSMVSYYSIILSKITKEAQ